MNLSLSGRRACAALVLAAAGVLAGCASRPAPPAPAVTQAGADLEIRFKPRRADGDKVSAVDVTLLIRRPGLVAGETALSGAVMRLMAPGGVEPETLRASDSAGPFALTVEDDPADPTDFRQDRRWIASRASEGDMRVVYTLQPRAITSATRPGPLVDIRTERTGVYGAGHTMLALPVSGWPRDTAVSWDLSEMEPGARAASSLGEGEARAIVSAYDLYKSFFMAGPLLSQPPDGASDFSVYWMTPAAFDLGRSAAWTEQAYRFFAEFFGTNATPFRVFMRTTERFQGGGGGGFNSFIFGTVFGEDRKPHEVQTLLAHEALHHFVGGYGGEGGGAGGQQWYSEGVTSYYTIVLPYRAGLTSLENYIDAFNAHSVSYFTNPRSNLSNAEVTRLFFADRNAQIVPYNRGPLYIALLDARIRSASGGALRVDDLIADFIAGQEAAEDGVALWHDLTEIYLGEAGGTEFRAMMAGEPLDLPPDLFGPCFTPEDRTLRNFNIGFRPYKDEDGQVRAGPVTVLSSAESAGIRRFDVILNPGVLDAAADTAPGSEVTLDISRKSERLTITYVPWTDPAPGRIWARSGAADTECNL